MVPSLFAVFIGDVDVDNEIGDGVADVDVEFVEVTVWADILNVLARTNFFTSKSIACPPHASLTTIMTEKQKKN